MCQTPYIIVSFHPPSKMDVFTVILYIRKWGSEILATWHIWIQIWLIPSIRFLKWPPCDAAQLPDLMCFHFRDFRFANSPWVLWSPQLLPGSPSRSHLCGCWATSHSGARLCPGPAGHPGWHPWLIPDAGAWTQTCSPGATKRWKT